jgi:hypothetical protein
VTGRDELLAALLAERYTQTPPRRRVLAAERVERLPVDAVAVIEHRRAAASRAASARAEAAYRRAARLAAAVPSETAPTLPPAAVRPPSTPEDDHVARLLAGVTKEPRR